MSTTLNLTELRAGGAKDLTSVAQIMHEAFDPRFGEGWTTAQCMGILSLPGAWLTLASIGGQDAGFALARSAVDDSELLLLATRPSARLRGVGGALLRSVIAESSSRNCTKLHLEVRSGNEAIQLYRREGFDKVGERRSYYKGKTGQLFDALTYARNIP
jgi:ribosomal-protein-alanine N-acetyltransferase